MRVMHRCRTGNPPRPRCPLGRGGGSWRVAEVGAEGTVPGCPQSMGLLCRAPVPPGASWDPGSGSHSRGFSAPGDALSPLPAAPQHRGGCSLGGLGRRGPQQEVAAGLFLSHAVARRHSQLFSLGNLQADNSAGVGCQPRQERGVSPRVLVAPHSRAPQGLAAGQRVRLPSQKLPPQRPSPWRRACGLGWGAESRMSPLPPSLPASWGGN